MIPTNKETRLCLPLAWEMTSNISLVDPCQSLISLTPQKKKKISHFPSSVSVNVSCYPACSLTGRPARPFLRVQEGMGVFVYARIFCLVYAAEERQHRRACLHLRRCPAKYQLPGRCSVITCPFHTSTLVPTTPRGAGRESAPVTCSLGFLYL